MYQFVFFTECVKSDCQIALEMLQNSLMTVYRVFNISTNVLYQDILTYLIQLFLL